MTDEKRIIIDAPSEMVILAARHLDATEGPVQVGRTVDTAARSAITTVLRYIAKAHNSPPAEGDDPPVQCWHTEPDSPCDWDVCRQPERLAAGDCGTDPARKERP